MVSFSQPIHLRKMNVLFEIIRQESQMFGIRVNRYCPYLMSNVIHLLNHKTKRNHQSVCRKKLRFCVQGARNGQTSKHNVPNKEHPCSLQLSKLEIYREDVVPIQLIACFCPKIVCNFREKKCYHISHISANPIAKSTSIQNQQKLFFQKV